MSVVQSNNFVDFEVLPQEPRGILRERTASLMTLRFEVCLWSIHLFLAKGGSCFHSSADAPKTAPTLSDEVVQFTGIDCSLLLQIHFFVYCVLLECREGLVRIALPSSTRAVGHTKLNCKHVQTNLRKGPRSSASRTEATIPEPVSM